MSGLIRAAGLAAGIVAALAFVPAAEASVRFSYKSASGFEADWIIRDSQGPSQWSQSAITYSNLISTEFGVYVDPAWRSINLRSGGGLSVERDNGTVPINMIGGAVLYSQVAPFQWAFNLGTHTVGSGQNTAVITLADVPTYYFRLTGQDQDIRFSLEQMPQVTFMAGGFRVNDLAATLNGVDRTYSQVRFLANGGFQLGQTVFSGTQRAYSGPRQYPTFELGSYALTQGGNAFNLQISANPFAAVVPEPATWLMLIAGMGGIGATLRSRRAAPPPRAVTA